MINITQIEYEQNGFKWDEIQQSKLLGSFFWLHWITQLPGGILASKFGSKMVFGLANFLACILCFLMPIACYLSFGTMIALRLMQGLIAGFAWPAMGQLTGRWIPPNERGKFISSYLGSSIGTAVVYPIFGIIIKATSWETVFHACGFAGIIWFILWQYFVSFTPRHLNICTM